MKVFISWSGKQSHAVALLLREQINFILNGVTPFVSSEDIESGERWGIEVAKELDESDFGILCLTADNKDKPWILFESGAIAKKMSSRLSVVLCGLDNKDYGLPLSQFQSKKLNIESEVFEVFTAINNCQEEANRLPADKLKGLFDAMWKTKIEGSIKEILEMTVDVPKPARKEGEILEDVVSGLRSLEQIVEALVRRLPKPSSIVPPPSIKIPEPEIQNVLRRHVLQPEALQPPTHLDELMSMIEDEKWRNRLSDALELGHLTIEDLNVLVLAPNEEEIDSRETVRSVGKLLDIGEVKALRYLRFLKNKLR